ncbi:CG5118, partial [Drosophila busckii]
MKKVLLTKSKQIQVTGTVTDLIRKHTIGVVATTPTISSSTGLRDIYKPNNGTNTYMQRKSFQSIYEDMFKLLMRLPDKALQQRVIDAINGRSDKSANQCKQCACKIPPKISVSTQTEVLDLKDFLQKSDDIKVKKDEEQKPKLPAPATGLAASSATSTSEPVKVVRKRGRKRNTSVPQVVKRSAAEMALQEREDKQLTPLPAVKKKKQESAVSGRLQQRRDSVSSNYSSCLGEINLLDMYNQVDNYINNDNEHTIISTMANEFQRADIMSESGLLPIHDAILMGDSHYVQRQLIVWSKLKNLKDLSELLSADGEDCMQLAITNNSAPEIVEILLKAGLLPNHIYEESNTALHLAIINNVQLESLRHLMHVIDLNLVLQMNDDGYTALHIAARHNHYKLAEVICDVIDERQLGRPVYLRDTKDLSSLESSMDEKKFAKYYEHACDRLEHNKTKLMGRSLKREVINGTEARAGNTPLYYAIEGELEHMCYFLLAHLSDPDEENLSGHSPKSYHYEFARVLRINLKIARIMDKVTSILNG